MGRGRPGLLLWADGRKENRARARVVGTREYGAEQGLKMPDFEPILLKRINAKASPWLDAYRADGGYRAVTKALTEMTPAQVVDTVKASGLRGRGGAGFPCGVKWTFLPKDHPGPIYLCVNADESEPCTFNNRVLMEDDPHQVLEGILLACYATKASVAYLYLRYEYGKA